ncbi:MAG TPA: outer membrane beta-barrel protein [Flavitalea sp.]|nr:outer membrane beta-barrel protein [Flavitalea sp.]
MKKIQRLCLMAVTVLLFAGLDASAQRIKLNINYGVGIPASANFKDYVSNTSFRGWNANLLYDVNDQLALGLGIGSQSFYQRYPRAIYKTVEGSDISAVMTNTVTSMPIMVQGQFNLLPEATVQPYVGLGVGGNLVLYNQYLGEFGGSSSKFGFAARPEAGVYIPVGRYKESSIVIGGAYNYLPIKEDNLKNLNNIGLYAGFKFPLR